MNQVKLASASFFLLMTACSGIPLFWRTLTGEESGSATEEVGKNSSDIGDHARAELEMQRIHYDGQTLSGRILVGAVGGELRLDRRFISSTSVNVDSVSDCTTGSPITFLLVDGFPPTPRDEDLLVLKPGYWYGTEVRFPLFSERFMGRAGPDCIDADVSLLSYGGEPVGRAHIRAVRPHQSPSDAGALEDLESSSDAGTPAEP